MIHLHLKQSAEAVSDTLKRVPHYRNIVSVTRPVDLVKLY